MIRRFLIAVALLAVAASAAAQGRRGGPPPGAGPRAGTVERITIAGSDVTVYLPPNYASDASRRFPTVYCVAERPVDAVKDAADKLSSAPGFSEPIVVMADASVAEKLVGDIDTRYRTIAARISRGLAGYSVAGDGALRVAMKMPDVFSSLYLLNASIVDATVAALDSNAASLQRYYSISINVGTTDAGLAMNRRLHDTMTRLRIPHYYEEFDGDNVSERVATRLLPFFSRNLTAPANPTSPAVQ